LRSSADSFCPKGKRPGVRTLGRRVFYWREAYCFFFFAFFAAFFFAAMKDSLSENAPRQRAIAI